MVLCKVTNTQTLLKIYDEVIMIPIWIKVLSALILFGLIFPTILFLLFDACVGQMYLNKRQRMITILFLSVVIGIEILLFISVNLYYRIPFQQWIG